jgi:hypothetical protein
MYQTIDIDDNYRTWKDDDDIVRHYNDVPSTGTECSLSPYRYDVKGENIQGDYENMIFVLTCSHLPPKSTVEFHLSYGEARDLKGHENPPFDCTNFLNEIQHSFDVEIIGDGAANYIGGNYLDPIPGSTQKIAQLIRAIKMTVICRSKMNIAQVKSGKTK